MKIWVLLLALFVVGCSQKPITNEVPQSYQNLRSIGQAYAQALTSLNRAPKNTEELKPFLKGHGDPSTLLKSPINGEEFVILWGVDYRKMVLKEGGYPVIAYEKTSNQGKRFVLQVRDVAQVTDEQFNKLPFPSGYKIP